MVVGIVSIGGLFLIVPVVVALLQTRRCQELLASASAAKKKMGLDDDNSRAIIGSSAHALAPSIKVLPLLPHLLRLHLVQLRALLCMSAHGARSEFLTDSSTIARRVIQLPGNGNNMGAMMLRKMVLEMHDRYGDGAATAVVMARAMLREGVKMVAAGANPVLMMRGIEHAIRIAEQANLPHRLIL